MIGSDAMSPRKARPSPAVPWVLAAVLPLAAGCGKAKDPAKTAGTEGVEVSAETAGPIADTPVETIRTQVRRRRESKQIDPSVPGWRTRLPLRPKVSFDAGRTYLWNLETSEGALRFRLLPEVAPEHVSNAIYLTLVGFYDGLAFYSVLPGRSVASGSPTDDDQGSPGYALTGPEGDRSRKHDRSGLLSAVSFGPGTDDSKFRVTLAGDASLDEHGTIYGELVEGDGVLRRIEALATDGGKTSQPVTIRRATLTIR
jgi:cyclophilin family peptidyl-prolyl cis-trans isomerase